MDTQSAPRGLTRYVVMAGAAGVLATAALAWDRPGPSWVPFAFLAALFAYAENTALDLPSGGGMSSSFMLVMAAAVIFRAEAAPVGVAAIGLCGGLYLPHLRRGEWRKVIGNAGAFGLASAAVAALSLAYPESLLRNPAALIAGSAVMAVAFFAVNTVVVAGYYALATGEPLRPVLGAMLRHGHLQVYPFAVLGVMLGRLYLDLGVSVLPLFVVPVLVARQTFASYLALRRAHEDTVRVLVGALEAKDHYTAGHAERVARFADYMGRELGFGFTRLERLRLAALMHDVGKLIVPNHLLNKPGKLTAEEYARVRRHEPVSVEILTAIDFLAPVAPSASGEFSRFENVDEERPVEPFIVAVADAFDAMTSTRSYRKALSQSVAVSELRDKAGSQFHPSCVDALVAALERRGEVYGAGHEEDAEHFDQPPPAAGLGSAGLGDLVPDPRDRST